jgi:5-methyltetrahydrofolate--homocysteine methyltransferase
MLIPEKPSFRTIFYSVAIRSQLGISPQGKEVVIADNLPTVLIGERINPFGKGPLKEAVISGDMEPIRQEAIKQVEAGADILIISVAAFGIDETATLPRVTEEVINALDHNKVQREFPGDLCVEPPE